MKQYEAVIKAMKKSGGYASLGQLYESVPQIPGCEWKTKTPFASIRRIVQTHPEFFRIRAGLWALSSEKKRVVELFAQGRTSPGAKEYSHYYFQGLIVEIGNLRGFETFIPAQDKNKPFANRRLGEAATVTKPYAFTYPEVLRKAETIDVTWFNARRFPDSFFEIEHSTDIQNSLLKFLELQDFRVHFRIVADRNRRREFEAKLALAAFVPIRSIVTFWDYDGVSQLHTKIAASVLAQQALQ
jgi:hypothetical protein